LSNCSNQKQNPGKFCRTINDEENNGNKQGEPGVQGVAPGGDEVSPFAGTEVVPDDGEDDAEEAGRHEALRLCHR